MIDLFARQPLLPALTEEEQAELDAVHSEEILGRSMVSILNEVCPRTPTGRRFTDQIECSDRKYRVARDGSFRRIA